jgi:hypothetical protein
MSKPLKKSKDVLKLAQRLRDELGIEIDTDHVYRIYAGHWQRSSGAWSWFAHRKLTDRAVVIVGSQYPIRQIVRAWKLTASQNVEHCRYRHRSGGPAAGRKIVENNACVTT